MKSIRIDLAMVDQKLVSSRTKAQDLIHAGHVFLDGVVVKSSSQIYNTGQITIAESELNRFVSRAGLKLEGALQQVSLQVEGFICLDIGMSTGGFTDCLLQKGAKKIIGVEVGQNQLAAKLKSNSAVRCFEKLNAKDLQLHPQFLSCVPDKLFNLCVIDVSFISLTHVLPQAARFSQRILALVKPQFELGPEALDKNGIVKDDKNYVQVESKIKMNLEKLEWKIESYFSSPLDGKDGNKEFFVYAHR